MQKSKSSIPYLLIRILWNSPFIREPVRNVCVKNRENGEKKTYKGIILSIDKNGIEIYWDTKNGKYRPSDMDIAFSHCKLEEIFNGNKYYSPIEKS